MEDYKKRLLNEYIELNGKLNKLDDFIIKYETGSLNDIKLTCPLSLLKRQSNLMWAYLRVLALRLKFEEIEV